MYAGERKNKILNQEEKTRSERYLTSSPIRISMNMTGKCNIRCIYCHLIFADYFTKQELSLNVFKKLRSFLKRVSHLVFFSSTEPLMAKYFDEAFDYSKEFETETYLSTNGLLIDDKRAERFVTGKLQFLTVSFGGFTEESFEIAHQVKGFSKVVENIERVNHYKKKYESEFPKIRLVHVVWKENAHELPLAVKLAKRLKCSEGLKITFLKAYDDNLIESVPFYHKQYVNSYVDEALKLAAELDVVVTFDGGQLDESETQTDIKTQQVNRKCFEPWERMHIEADGSVRVCPIPTNTIVAGNINEDQLSDIWNGEVYRMFRDRTNSDNPPDPCKRCTHNFHKNFSREDVWDQRDLDLGIYKRLEGRNRLKQK